MVLPGWIESLRSAKRLSRTSRPSGVRRTSRASRASRNWEWSKVDDAGGPGRVSRCLYSTFPYRNHIPIVWYCILNSAEYTVSCRYSHLDAPLEVFRPEGVLDLGGQALRDLAPLTTWPGLPRVQRIHLGGNDLDDEALAPFLEALPRCDKLRRLNLRGNRLSGASVKAGCGSRTSFLS